MEKFYLINYKGKYTIIMIIVSIFISLSIISTIKANAQTKMSATVNSNICSDNIDIIRECCSGIK